MKAALRKHLFAARARLALALLRLALWIEERDVKPENTSQPAAKVPPPDASTWEPITPEARELLVEDPPPVEVALPAGDVIRRVVRSPNG